MVLCYPGDIAEGGGPRTVDASRLPHFPGSLGHFDTSVRSPPSRGGHGASAGASPVARDSGVHDEPR